MTEEFGIAHFRSLLRENIAELKGYCEEWEKLSNGSDAPEMVCDEIRTTVGLTKLLLQQKLKQFAGLIDDSEFKTGEKEITCLDLQGFWDMVYNEVEKIQKRFQSLEKCQQNNWVFVEETTVKRQPKKKPTLAAVVNVTVDAKARALAARQRLAEAKLKMRGQMLKKSENSGSEHVLDTLKENVLEQKLEVDQKFGGISASVKPNTVYEAQSPPKRTLKNIRNLKISEQDDISIKSSAVKGNKLKSSKREKENLAKYNEECIVPNTPKKKN